MQYQFSGSSKELSDGEGLSVYLYINGDNYRSVASPAVVPAWLCKTAKEPSMAMDRQTMVIDVTPLRVSGVLHKTIEFSSLDTASMEVSVPILKVALAEIKDDFEMTRPILKKGDVTNITDVFGVKAMKNKLASASSSGVKEDAVRSARGLKSVQHILK
jgi:hypothetical protein